MYKDSFKVYFVILHYYIHFWYKFSSVWNPLVEYQSISSVVIMRKIKR